jgi:hypothetical protein
MRRRGGLNKIGILAIALIIALGAVGVTYSAWVDEIYIEGSLYTGDINASVGCNGVGSVVPDPYPIVTGITCNPVPNESMKLQFSVTNALPNRTYTCPFKVNNLDDDLSKSFESLPIKVDEANSTLTAQGEYSGITASVNLTSDPQIDPGGTGTGQVQIVVGPDATAGQNLVYILEVKVVRWNK